jgi:hypothetical protein
MSNIAPEERARRKRESHRKGQAKWRAKNPERVKQNQRAWYAKNPGKHAEYRRTQYYRNSYKMTVAEAESFKSQAGGCAICLSDKRLVIDHDHKTNTIRGVLCDNCNKGIGLLGDTREGLLRAVAYLK